LKPFDALAEGLQIENDTDKSKQIELFWDAVREYPEDLLPLFVKLRL
jgi:hypothetical protein